MKRSGIEVANVKSISRCHERDGEIVKEYQILVIEIKFIEAITHGLIGNSSFVLLMWRHVDVTLF